MSTFILHFSLQLHLPPADFPVWRHSHHLKLEYTLFHVMYVLRMMEKPLLWFGKSHPSGIQTERSAPPHGTSAPPPVALSVSSCIVSQANDLPTSKLPSTLPCS